jgi:uncharacterized protein YbjT (DUF2867 family)
MNKLLLFGASGNAGRAIAKEAMQQGYAVTAVVRNYAKATEMEGLCTACIIADITNKEALAGICAGYGIVISALGKSVSPNDSSKPSFYDIDFVANSNILDAAKANGVKKFIYLSAFHAEKYTHLNYFRVHHDFSEKLKAAGIDYTIIKPPALFSAYVDLIALARKGQLVTIGKGDKRTNPISETDLAKAAIQHINNYNSTLEIGGKLIYSRKRLNEIIQQAANGDKKIRSVPTWLFKAGLPFLKLMNKNLHDKLAFFCAVTQADTLAPQIGDERFEDYIKKTIL